MRKRTAGASIIALALAATGAWAVARFAPAHCTGNVEGPKDMDEESAVIKGGSFLCASSYCARYREGVRWLGIAPGAQDP